MQNLFNSVKLNRPKTNRFDLSHDVKLSCNMGDLIPICCVEAVPGDKFQIAGDALFRMAPMLAPMMHRVDVTLHYWFVPNRILWGNWEKFITGNYPDPLGQPHFPTLDFADASTVLLANYFGIPNANTADARLETVNAMPFAAYQKIWDTFYRDQNLQTELYAPQTYPLNDGTNQPNFNVLTALRKRCWEHDYFTSALPFAQKGDPVSLPNGTIIATGEVGHPGKIRSAGTTLPLPGTPLSAENATGQAHLQSGGLDAFYDPNGSLITDATTINDLRRAYALQAWLERNARGGTRYAEHIKAHWGITSSDKRLQRPEYIVGVKNPIVISEVLNTTGTETTPQGGMSGHGAGVATGKFGSYFCEEHGFVIGVMSVMPKTAYQQGLEKFWFKTLDPLQYFYPAFAHIGEQEVLNSEVYAYQANGQDTFGYVPRYAEYKFMNSRVAGDFRTTLNFWHMGRIFDSAPALNGDFVQSDPTTRIFAVEEDDVDHIWCHVVNKISASRMMPRFGTPSTI